MRHVERRRGRIGPAPVSKPVSPKNCWAPHDRKIDFTHYDSIKGAAKLADIFPGACGPRFSLAQPVRREPALACSAADPSWNGTWQSRWLASEMRDAGG